jgi:hypothetical protein
MIAHRPSSVTGFLSRVIQKAPPIFAHFMAHFMLPTVVRRNKRRKKGNRKKDVQYRKKTQDHSCYFLRGCNHVTVLC